MYCYLHLKDLIGVSFLQGPSERLLVAAIDIGTTFSGYAFSFLHEYLSDPMRISTNNWPHENGMSMKAPTSILLGPDGNLKAFGYEAISKFGDLAENNQHQDHYFFRQVQNESVPKCRFSIFLKFLFSIVICI